MSTLLNTLVDINYTSPSSIIYSRAVPVSFSANVSGVSVSALGVPYQEIWQFGDGEYSYDSAPTHTFKNKGVYPVKYTAILPNSSIDESNNEVRTLTATVSVFNFIEDEITWLSGAAGTYQSVKQTTPFVIALSSTTTEDDIPYVQLYSRGSNSQPWQDPQQKWSHLKPQWRFTDVSGNVVSTLQPTDYTTITLNQSGVRTFDGSGTIVGLSALVYCYYIDDLPSQNLDNSIVPVTLVTTLVTSGYDVNTDEIKYVPSYLNSSVTSEIAHNIKYLTPDHLKVTVNGITPISDVIWQGAYTPYTVTVHPASPYSDVILKNFPLNSSTTSTFIQGLSNIPASSVVFAEDISLSRYDSDGFDTGGYFKSSFYPLVSSSNTVISVSGVVSYGSIAVPYGFWYSDPSINSIIYKTLSGDRTLNHYISAVYAIDSSQIYGVARDVNSESDAAWFTDPTNDKVYRVSRSFGIDRIFDLTRYTEFSAFSATNGFGLTPTGIVLNSSGYLWVSLFDGVSSIQLNPDTGVIQQVAVLPTSSYYIDIPGVSGFGGENLIRPAAIDVDKQDNVWVAYNHPLSSFLCKFSDSGVPLLSVTFPTYSQPYGIVVDNENSLWVTLYHIASSDLPLFNLSSVNVDNGAVLKYDSDGNMLSAFGSFRYPSHITLSFDQTPYFTHDKNYVSYIDQSTGNISTTVITVTSTVTNLFNGRLYTQWVNGVSTDWYNNIWVVSNFKQAYGDWQGTQWFNKFGYVPLSAIGSTVTLNLEGQSDNFSIEDFESSYNVRKINEDFDGVNKMRAITLQQNIKRNDVLFNKLIAPIAGTYDGDPLLPGTAIYEKIANFVGNHGDVDTCNVPQLYSLHEMIDIPIDKYQFEYPADIKRVMDLMSVSLTRLKPTRSKYSKDFKKYNVVSSGSNIGKLIDTKTYTASAGEKVVFNIKYSTNYEEIELTPITSDILNVPQLSATYSNYPLSSFPLSTFPISAYYGWGLDTPIYDYYFVYHYVPGYDDTQVEGLIDWDNTNTTLTENISSTEEWYKDNGLVDLMFNYYIFRGLGLIKS